ncbi:MAG: hypothetical protein K940chlam3_00123 [Chlamydiae bacterium]|nr:hypothetical protein [Chlamydiota bacterium]
MKSLFFTAICAVVFSLSSTGFGLDQPDIYVHGFGGPNYLVIRRTDDVKIEAQPGYLIGVGVGLKYGRGRVEFEGSYRRNDFREDIPIGPNMFFEGGKTEKVTCFINFLVDFSDDLFIHYLKPYMGAGIGHKWDMEDISIEGFEYDGTIWRDRFTYKAHGVSFQGIAGIGIPMTQNTITKIEYRFLKDEKNLTNHSAVLNVTRSF